MNTNYGVYKNRKTLRRVWREMSAKLLEEDDAPLDFSPCRDESCNLEELHPVHDIPVDRRAIKPQTEVCSRCLDLVKPGRRCACGALEMPTARGRRQVAQPGEVALE